MNTAQRQLLADRINELENSILAADDAVSTLSGRLIRAQANLKKMQDELAELKEGIDW